MEYKRSFYHIVYRGEHMDKQAVVTNPAVHELELEIMLHINNRLFKSGNITEEMYEKAKEIIIKL